MPAVNVCSGPPCSPTATPPTTPTPTAIPDEFQPRDANGNRTSVVLEWRIFKPTGTGPWPGMVVFHEGHFAGGNIFAPAVEQVATDLKSNGYCVYVAAFRAAPCGLIKGQPCHNDDASGRPPQQTDDCKAFVRAARQDGNCTKKVGVIGGSSGGSHAAFLAFDQTSSVGWPNWTKADRPDAAACLSGAYDFACRIPESYVPDPLPSFIGIVENYTNSCVPNFQRSKSPVSLLTSSTADIPPIYLINSEQDTMPYHQIEVLQCAFQNAGVNSSLYQFVTIPSSSEHGYAYWRNWNGGPCIPTCKTRGSDIINFLDSHLK